MVTAALSSKCTSSRRSVTSKPLKCGRSGRAHRGAGGRLCWPVELYNSDQCLDRPAHTGARSEQPLSDSGGRENAAKVLQSVGAVGFRSLVRVLHGLEANIACDFEDAHRLPHDTIATAFRQLVDATRKIHRTMTMLTRAIHMTHHHCWKRALWGGQQYNGGGRRRSYFDDQARYLMKTHRNCRRRLSTASTSDGNKHRRKYCTRRERKG